MSGAMTSSAKGNQNEPEMSGPYWQHTYGDRRTRAHGFPSADEELPAVLPAQSQPPIPWVLRSAEPNTIELCPTVPLTGV